MRISLLALCFLFTDLILANTPKLVCPNFQMQKQFEKLSLSRSKTQTRVEVNPSITRAVLTVGSQRDFQVLANVFSSNAGYVTRTFLLKYQSVAVNASNVLVNVWVERNAYFSGAFNNLNTTQVFANQTARENDRDTTLNEMGNLLRDTIMPGTVAAFGVMQEVASSTNDGINVLVYDINDGFNGSSQLSYVGGYFDPADKFNENQNRMNILHMDIYPNNPGGVANQSQSFGITKRDFYHVLAHEMQHVIHSQGDRNETVWVNEGFSQYAIYRTLHQKTFTNSTIILNSPNDQANQVPLWLSNTSSSLLMSFDETGLAASGNSNDSARQDSAELRGLGYLFFAYLWERLGGQAANLSASFVASTADNRMKTILNSSAKGNLGIQEGLTQAGLNFDQVFHEFSIALLTDPTLVNEARYKLEAFRSHANVALLAPIMDLDSSPQSAQFSLRPYESRFLVMRGNSQARVLSISSSSVGVRAALVNDGNQIVENPILSQSHSLTVPQGFTRSYLTVSNPSFFTSLVTVTPPGAPAVAAASSSQKEETKKSGCFVATAAYAGADNQEVQILSRFRDRFLLNSVLGQEFVSFYYRYSPPLASLIEKSSLLALIVQILLLPLVILASLLLQPSFLLALLLLLPFVVKRTA